MCRLPISLSSFNSTLIPKLPSEANRARELVVSMAASATSIEAALLTKPNHDASIQFRKRILVTGGAGFMYVYLAWL